MNATLHEISAEEIMAHYDGELAAERAKEVSVHLDICNECRVLRESFRPTSLSLANWSVDVASLSVEPLLERSRAQLSWWGLKARSLVFAVAGAALIATLGIVATLSHNKNSSQYSVRRIDFSGNTSTVGGSRAGRGQSVDRAEVNTAPVAEMSDQISKLPVNGRSITQLTPLTPGVAPEAPMIARSVDLQIIAKDFVAVRGALEAVLARHQGYAANLGVANTDNTARALSASLRIPAPQLDAALSELRSLGRVTAEGQSGEEVTAQHADLVARLKNSRETEIRLQDILRNRTGKVRDILEVEQEIARVRGEIEQMESELKTLNHRVDFATINLTITEEYKAKVSGNTPAIGIRLHNAAVAGLQSAASAAFDMVLWLIEIMPSFLLWVAILGFPAWWLWRRTQRAFASAS